MRLRGRAPGRATSALLGTVAAVVLGGVAAAFWTATTGGAGSGSTGVTQPVDLSPATPSADLYPGERADVVLTVTNPNAGPVVISSLRLDGTRGDGGFAVDSGHAGCATSALSFTAQTSGDVGWTVPGRQGTVDGRLSITLGDSLAMALDATDACQGATITVYLVAGP